MDQILGLQKAEELAQQGQNNRVKIGVKVGIGFYILEFIAGEG